MKDAAYDSYQARDDMETLLRADKIRKDPERMKNVKRAAKEKLAEQQGLKDLAAGADKK